MWVRPNAAFDSTRSTFEDSVCRLAWVVNVKMSNGSDEDSSLLTIFLDAGDGSELGGDMVE
jgi:hypothetical protein